jgi:hypothetical protein
MDVYEIPDKSVISYTSSDSSVVTYTVDASNQVQFIFPNHQDLKRTYTFIFQARYA